MATLHQTTLSVFPFATTAPQRIKIDMASIRKRQDKWQAQVRRKGMPTKTKSFIKKEDAIKWSRQQELNLDKGIVDPIHALSSQPFRSLLEKYEAEITPQKKSKESEAAHLRQIKRHAISAITVSKICSQHIAQFRDDRLKAVTSPTVRKEVSLIGSIFSLAAREWGLVGVANPVIGVKKPPNGLARDRRLYSEEQLRFDDALTKCRNSIVISAIKFARATAMRRSEMLSLKWSDVDLISGVAQLKITKNGLPRTVPLCPNALVILDELLPGKPDGLIFPISPNALRLAFDRACRRASVKNFHFHDLRHESISRFFEAGLSVIEVATISGHKDLRMLNRYTHLRPKDIADKLKAIHSIK